jgi:uncharacterized protein with PIN domain
MNVPEMNRHAWAMVAAAMAEDEDGIELLLDDLSRDEQRLMAGALAQLVAGLMRRDCATREQALGKVRAYLAEQSNDV